MKRLAIVTLIALFASPAWAAKKPKAPPVPVAEPAPPPVDPEAWRAKPPGPGPKGAWAPPVAKTFTLTNGIPVYLLENPGLPLVSIDVVMLVGREANPAGKAGLAMLTASMLDEGTAARPGNKLAADAAMLGASVGSGQGDELAWTSLSALTGASLAPSLDLLAEMTLKPAFSAADFDRVKVMGLNSIQASRAEPRDVARRVFAQQLFGAGHPYGVPSVGDTASVSSLKVSDVKAFYKAWWHAKNAAIVAAGAVDEATLKPMLEARFGSWKAGKQTRLAAAAPAAPARTRVVFVEQPGAVQSVINVGTVGVSRTNPDYMATNVAGTLVGGMFSSPINMNLREDKGWSYGAFGGLIDARDHGVFAVRTSVQADKTAPAVKEILGELSKAAGRAPTSAELTMAKDYLREAIPANFETNAAAVDSFASAATYGLGPDLWRGYVQQLDAVTEQQSASMAQRFFDSARQLVVVAGPRTIEVPGEGGAVTRIDVAAELKGLGYEFVEVTLK